MKALYHLSFVDHDTRRKHFLFIFIGSLIFLIARDPHFTRSPDQSAVEAVIAVAVGFLVTSVYYCLTWNSKQQEESANLPRFFTRATALKLASAGTIGVFLNRFSLESVYAKTIEGNLNRYKVTGDRKFLSKSSSELLTAKSLAIAVPSSTVDLAIKAFEDGLSQASRNSEVGSPYEGLTWYLNVTEQVGANFPGEGRILKGMSIYGSGMPLSPPKGAVFTTIDFLLRHPRVPCPEFVKLEGQGPDTVYPLDGMFFKNCLLKNMKLTYHGGPLILENSIFVDCTFDLTYNSVVLDFVMENLNARSTVNFKAS